MGMPAPRRKSDRTPPPAVLPAGTGGLCRAGRSTVRRLEALKFWGMDAGRGGIAATAVAADDGGAA